MRSSPLRRPDLPSSYPFPAAGFNPLLCFLLFDAGFKSSVLFFAAGFNPLIRFRSWMRKAGMSTAGRLPSYKAHRRGLVEQVSAPQKSAHPFPNHTSRMFFGSLIASG